MELVIVLEDNNLILRNLIENMGIKRSVINKTEGGDMLLLDYFGYIEINSIPPFTNYIIYNCRKDFRKFISLATLIKSSSYRRPNLKIELGDFIKPENTTTEIDLIYYDNRDKVGPIKKDRACVYEGTKKFALAIYDDTYAECSREELRTFRHVFDADLIISLQDYRVFEYILTKDIPIRLSGNNFTLGDVKKYINRWS